MFFCIRELTFSTEKIIICNGVIAMNIISVRHDWPEKAGFLMSRPEGIDSYTFIHFSTPVIFKIGGRVINARPGACILYEPHTPQWFHSDKEVIHNWIHFGEDFAEVIKEYNIPLNTILYPNNTAFISDLFRKLEQEHFSENLRKAQLMENYAIEFLIRFERALAQGVPAVHLTRKERDKMRSIRQEVLSTPEKRWNVGRMAEAASLSPSRFHAVYKSAFGTSPMQDVIQSKVNYACSLLLADEAVTLQEIAEKLGYNDQYRFIRQFKAVMGDTPGAYRRKRKQ